MIYYEDLHIKLLNEDCRQMSDLPDQSVQVVVTSPPYWGLRKYSGDQDLIWGGDKDCQHEWGEASFNPVNKKNPNRGPNSVVGRPTKEANKTVRDRQPVGNNCQLCGAWRGAFGLEPTPELYVQHTIEILREIRRVLRKDGVVFWNIGDSYNSSQPGYGEWTGEKARQGDGEQKKVGMTRTGVKNHPSLKPKDLCLIPFRVAIAAQEDGWWVRSDIIWSKPNPMPESVTDRPTNSHEYILMLTKSAKYYWDAEAVREIATGFDGRKTTTAPKGDGSHQNYAGSDGHERWPNKVATKYTGTDYGGAGSSFQGHSGYTKANGEVMVPGRNLRSVWEFNEDDEQGGNFYKVLQGCPIHSPLLHPEIVKTLQDGEPQDYLLSHTLDRYGCLVPVLSASLLSKIYHTNSDDLLAKLGFHHHGNELSQIIENTDENKMSLICYHGDGHKSCLQMSDHTKHNKISDGCQVYNLSYPYPFYSEIATEHSKEIHKTVSLIATSGSVYVQIPDRIARILQTLGCTCSYNNYTTSHFPLQDVWSFSTQPYAAAHFAVFPEKLPDLCIKAATPEVGCCSQCGKPWTRVLDKKSSAFNIRVRDAKAGRATPEEGYKATQEEIDNYPGNHPDPGYRQTTGWQPQCKCDAEKVPSTVLDCFAGAGTTLWVAKKLNRKAVGYELSEEYCDLIVTRNRQQVLT